MRSLFIFFPVSLLLAAWVSPALADEWAATEDDLPTPAQIAAWRAEGPAALERLMEKKNKWKYRFGLIESSDPIRYYEVRMSLVPERFDAAVDQVAGAKYSHLSGLYWYTDEILAKAAAQREKKPILTLRLLGNLTDELSCANSRFFRQLLYPNDAIKKLLHDRFVLHWQSLRPVPTITVDMHNGCKLEQSITGNSAHYVLMPDGEVIDVIPGLYAPVQFQRRLESALTAFERAMGDANQKQVLKAYRQEQLAQLKQAWQSDLARYEQVERVAQVARFGRQEVGSPPPPPLPLWETLGGFHREFGELDKLTLGVLREEALAISVALAHAPPSTGNPLPDDAISYAYKKGALEAPFFSEMAACLIRDLAADTVKNEYFARYRALQHLDAKRQSLAELNHWVYAKLFGYEINKPWAGMESSVQYAALPEHFGGYVAPRPRPEAAAPSPQEETSSSTKKALGQNR